MKHRPLKNTLNLLTNSGKRFEVDKMKRVIISILAILILTTNVYADSFDLSDAINVLNIVENNRDYDVRLDINNDGVINFEDCAMILKKFFTSQPETAGMTVTVNSKTFDIELYDTKAAEEFAEMLPQTFNMTELNGNEKYIYTDTQFTSAAQKIGHINAGDIMLYGNNCIVLFYKSFDTPYSYTKIGHITNTAEFEETVGKGNITAKFSK